MKNAVRALSRGDLTQGQTELYLELVDDGLGRIEQTVKKFLTFTPRRVEPKPADLTEIAEKSLALAMHRIRKNDVAVETSFALRGEAVVFGDANELQQVALNLLLNAADALAGRPDARIDLRVERKGDEAVLSVADNGPGLAPEDQDRCFDMFFTTKEVGEGSGMGLAVVHTIVTNHGGRIELHSAPDEGATFLVVLPCEPRVPAPERVPEAAERA